MLWHLLHALKLDVEIFMRARLENINKDCAFDHVPSCVYLFVRYYEYIPALGYSFRGALLNQILLEGIIIVVGWDVIHSHVCLGGVMLADLALFLGA